MIDEQRTLEIYGYTSDELSQGSGKLIIVICDECKKERTIEKRAYFRLNGDKKVCKSCSRLGNKHWLYGKPRPEETKNKIRKTRIERGCGLGFKHSEESKRKMSTKQMERDHNYLVGKNNGRWKGGISFEPYCPKFNNRFKESIRDKFNRICFICGISEKDMQEDQKERNKKPFKLHVHHVSYDKECMCNDNMCEFVPLCHSCHATTNTNRDYWEYCILDKLWNGGV